LPVKITIVYDNVVWEPALTPDWGFACVVETDARALLFDTGARGDILLGNMERPMAIEVLIRRRLSGKKKWRAYEMRIRNCRRYLAQ
jgi:hypothetical protein